MWCFNMAKNSKHLSFSSDRLSYRPMHDDDFHHLIKLDADPDVRTYFPSGTLDEKRIRDNLKKNIAFFQENGFGVFIVTELKTGEFVGRCGFGKLPSGDIEVGYVFLKQFWGQGLASEALIAMLEWAEKHIHCVNTIVALSHINHAASIRVMQKAGMIFLKKDYVDNQECVFYHKVLRDKGGRSHHLTT